MSDSVVKLRIDSKEYDANIKRAGQALTDYFNKVKEGGGTLMHLDEGVMEAVKAMGSLGTQANNTKGGLRELTQAATDMTAAYRALTDEEKASPLGQAMQKSIAQMTERAGNMRDAMADVQASINNAASDTRVFDQIAGGAQMMTAGFQSAVGAMKLFGVETDNNVEVLAQLQAAMGVVNGLQTIQTALQKQSAVMQGVQAVQAAAAAAAQTSLAGATGAATVAQKAFNLVANANPYVLLATAVAAVGTALYAFASASSKAKQEAEEMAKAEEEAAKKSEDARNAFVNAAAEAMNSASRLSSLQVAYKNANSEIEKTNVLKQAQAEFKKLGIECKGVNDAQTLLIKNGSKVIELIQLQGNVAAVSAVRMEKFKESFKMLMENGYSASAAASLAGYNKEVQELDGQITTMQGKIQNLNSGLGIGAGGNTKTTKVEKQTDKFAADSIMAQEKWIAQLENEWKRAGASIRDEYIPMIEMAKKKLEEMKGGTAKESTPQMTVGLSGFNEQTISAWTSIIKSDLAKADIGSDLYNSLTKNLRDMSFLTTTVQDAIKLGLDIPQDAVQQMFEKVFDQGNLPADMYTGMIQKFIDEFKERTGKDLQVGADGSMSTGKDKKNDDRSTNKLLKLNEETGKYEAKANELLSTMSGGIQNITTALESLGIEIPTELKSVIGGMQSISAILTGIATTVLAIQAITTADTIIPFAGGGIVGRAASGMLVGTHMSGDNLRMPVMGGSGGFIGVNDGEVILNRAQQGNLASQLEGGGISNLHLETIISAEDIRVVLKNNGRRTGRGEYITSRNSRS